MKTKSSPVSNINSSYLVFIAVSAVAFSYFFSGFFHGQVQQYSFITNILFTLGLFTLIFMLRQFVDVSKVFVVVFLSVLIVGSVFIADMFSGALSSGTLPIMCGRWASSCLRDGNSLVPIYGATVMYYAMLTYFCSLLAAGIFELLYRYLVQRMLPRSVATKLAKIDRGADSRSQKVSDSFFMMNQGIGLVLCLLLVAALSVNYVTLVIFKS